MVLDALLDPTAGVAQANVAPGDTRVISREVSGGLVTVDLSIHARNVQSEQELLRMYLAIAGTLLELEGIEGVNVLIGGREEGLLGLPCGVFTEVETDVTAVWAQMQAESDRYQGNAQGAATRTAALVAYTSPTFTSCASTARSAASASAKYPCSTNSVSSLIFFMGTVYSKRVCTDGNGGSRRFPLGAGKDRERYPTIS